MCLRKNVNKNYYCNKNLFKGIIIYMQIMGVLLWKRALSWEVTLWLHSEPKCVLKSEDASLSQAPLTIVSEINLSKGVRGIIRKHLASSIWVLGNIQVQMDTTVIQALFHSKCLEVWSFGLQWPFYNSPSFGHGLCQYLYWRDNAFKLKWSRGHCW